MTYPQNYEQKTGFDVIRQLLRDKCISPLGKESVDEITFSSDISAITPKLRQTQEFLQILRDEEPFPTDHFIDIRHALKRVRPEGTHLDEKELFDIKRTLTTIHNITRFLAQSPGHDKTKYPTLAALAAGAPVFPNLISRIDAILDKYGRIKDSASPGLTAIRKELTSVMANISRSLQSILRSAQSDGFIDKDVTPAMRDGRLVLPVAPAFKRKIRGIIHDESATGKTVFIEPQAVVEANNRIRELESEEKREIIKILAALTDAIRPAVPDILRSCIFLAHIDFIRAKALLALEINAIMPPIENAPLIDWTGAIHPLLFLSLKKQGKTVVPLDITLDSENRLLIISGPNAGGKSVCLKTVGLLQHMLQCGLLIPLRETSRTGIFHHIFIDIGDEQSIENDLSTYSSHLTNMKFFIKNASANTLILIDEFGSGTEPSIGGALAEAILERLNHTGNFGLITTHYHNLKQYAEQHPGIINGAMLYDRHLMQPLFELAIGRPGSSFAIEIARKIGLPDDLIDQASQKVGNDCISMDKYLQDIIRDKRYWESKRQNIRQHEKKLEELTARCQKDLDSINRQRKEILQEAKTQATAILAETNAKIENTIRQIKESQANRERTKALRTELENFKSQITAPQINPPLPPDSHCASSTPIDSPSTPHRLPSTPRRKTTPPSLAKGDTVRIEGHTSLGTILEIKHNRAIIASGAIKMTLPTAKLEKVHPDQIPPSRSQTTFISPQTADSIHEKKLNFNRQIDVRGMHVDEAIQAVTCFIDDALIAGISPVRILHGTGTGALRQHIRDYLATLPTITRFHDEHIQYGGAGITVVEIPPT
jgi:DNA mismatch repair protein MutS2